MLEDFSIIKCAPGEKVLGIQRRHPLVIALIMATQILTAFLFLLFSIVIISSFGNDVLIVYIALTVISTLIVVLFFSFMSWYYEFYVITNKAILHRKSFRIVGFYTEAVMLSQVHEQRIERNSTNLIYDLLKIQDVYVYFSRLEREDPFIFKTPVDAQVIEDLLQNLITKNGSN